jgi:hypothetical protein
VSRAVRWGCGAPQLWGPLCWLGEKLGGDHVIKTCSLLCGCIDPFSLAFCDKLAFQVSRAKSFGPGAALTTVQKREVADDQVLRKSGVLELVPPQVARQLIANLCPSKGKGPAELGEAFQLNWSEEGLVVGGIYYRLQVSHMKLSCAPAERSGWWRIPAKATRCRSMGTRAALRRWVAKWLGPIADVYAVLVITGEWLLDG